jgi:uncharacterized membrane protein YGL010W
MIPAMMIVDAFLLTLTVMTIANAPLILAAHVQDANILKYFATIIMFVLKILVLMMKVVFTLISVINVKPTTNVKLITVIL